MISGPKHHHHPPVQCVEVGQLLWIAGPPDSSRMCSATARKQVAGSPGFLILCASVFGEVSITRKLSYRLEQKTGAGQ